MDAKRTKEARTELQAAGYLIPEAMRFAQGKCPLYRHKPMLNDNGVLVKPCGDVVVNQPRTTDHIARVATRGLRMWEFRGVCILAQCVCRAQMSSEDFDNWMHSHSVYPEQVMPGATPQNLEDYVAPPKQKPAVALVDPVPQMAQPTMPFFINCAKCGELLEGTSEASLRGRRAMHSRYSHPSKKARRNVKAAAVMMAEAAHP